MSTACQSAAAVVVESPGFGWLGSLVIAAGVTGVVLAYTIGLRSQRPAPPVRMGLLSLRLGAVTCIFVALWHPVCTREAPGLLRPTLAVVLDDSASMGQPAAVASGAPAPSRYDRAAAVLRDRLQPLVAGTHRLRLFDVDGRSIDARPLPNSPAETSSPLTDTLLGVQRDLRDQHLAGIVLLSDGREVCPRPTVGTIEQLEVPVHTVQFLDDSGAGAATSVSIQAVSANRRALVNNAVRVTVDVAAEGLSAGVRVPVTILDGTRPAATTDIAWPVDQSTARAELTFVPRRPGDFVYLAQVGAPAGDVDLADNRAPFPLHVSAKPLTVLYVDGVLRWEGKFLREALASDPDVNFVATVRTTRPGADHGSQGLLLPEQLAHVQVVVLGDIEAAFFSAAELTAVRNWVTEDAGALLLTGGYRSFGPDGFGGTPLRGILPVEFSADPNPQSDQPFNLRLTEAGRDHPIFDLTHDRARDVAFFHALPRLGGCSRIAGVKPGAQVLAVNPDIAGPDGGRGLPVLVVQDVGAGRAMVFAVDTTWRWRTIVGGFLGDSAFYARFWGQLVRWLAIAREEAPVRLQVATDRQRCRPGQNLELRVGLHAESGDAAATPTPVSTAYRVSATAWSENGDQWSVPLADLGDSRFRGPLAARLPGRLDICVQAEPLAPAAVDRPALSALTTIEVERPDLETLDPRPDPQWLAQVAQRTGGRVVRPEQLEAWAADLPADPVPTVAAHATGPAAEHLLAGLFLALLCSEWILRRWNRLP